MSLLGDAMSDGRRLARAALAGSFVVLVVSVGLRAFQGPGGAGAGRGFVPLTASSLLRDPAPHIGENVSVMAAVHQILTKTVFTVEQKTANSKPLLVIAPTLSAPLPADAY